MENDDLWLPLQDWDHPTHLPHPSDTPTSHTHLPHLPATPIYTPTCYTLQPLPLVLWLMCVMDVCARWACQVRVSGGRVTGGWHTYLTHPPDTPTWHIYLLLLQPLPCVHATHVCGGWVCEVGVSGRCAIRHFLSILLKVFLALPGSFWPRDGCAWKLLFLSDKLRSKE